MISRNENILTRLILVVSFFFTFYALLFFTFFFVHNKHSNWLYEGPIFISHSHFLSNFIWKPFYCQICDLKFFVVWTGSSFFLSEWTGSSPTYTNNINNKSSFVTLAFEYCWYFFPDCFSPKDTWFNNRCFFTEKRNRLFANIYFVYSMNPKSRKLK